MKKVLDTKSLLLENMAKLNPDFKLTEADKKWIQKAVNPEHKGYCTPMSKPTCTPRRKALAKRFKKGIEESKKNLKENINFPDTNLYKTRVAKIKEFIDSLLNQGELEVIDTLYRLLIDRKNKHVSVPNNVNEDNSSEYQEKVEHLKGKIDYLFDTNHYDILDKIDDIISKLFPISDEELAAELA
jgi:hypothetical protein